MINQRRILPSFWSDWTSIAKKKGSGRLGAGAPDRVCRREQVAIVGWKMNRTQRSLPQYSSKKWTHLALRDLVHIRKTNTKFAISTGLVGGPWEARQQDFLKRIPHGQHYPRKLRSRIHWVYCRKDRRKRCVRTPYQFCGFRILTLAAVRPL